MDYRYHASLLCLMSVAFLPIPTDAQAPSSTIGLRVSERPVPRTSWGEPSIEGVYSNFHEINVPLERPARFEGRQLSDITGEELAAFRQELNDERRRRVESDPDRPIGFTWHTFDLNSSRAWLISDPEDGKLPPLTSDGRRREAAMREMDARSEGQRGTLASVDDLNLLLRCIATSRGVIGSTLPSVEETPISIVQGPGVVAIAYERIHDTRVIPIGPSSPPRPTIRAYSGQPRGHWEGNTLVVETRNFTNRTTYRGSSDDLVLIERFTPTSSDALEWSVTFVDPATWVKPWTMGMSFRRTTDPPLEFACHEGNYGMLRNFITNAGR
jgi:hypothetical protein